MQTPSKSRTTSASHPPDKPRHHHPDGNLHSILRHTLGYVFYQQGQADRAAEQGVPGDGRISPVEWQRFVASQVSLITQGKELSEEAHELFCQSELPIGIKPAAGQATRRLLHQHDHTRGQVTPFRRGVTTLTPQCCEHGRLTRQ